MNSIFWELQKRCIAIAPDPRKILRPYEDFWHSRLGGRHCFEERAFVDELVEASDANSREIVVWKPKFPVLTEDSQWLFHWLRENSYEQAPTMAGSMVVYYPVVA